jgi:NADH dehydrogenase [ubiquinone] 1 alpha subcomplex assembly factor 1
MFTFLLTAALVSGDVVHDFSLEDAARFECVNDTVMGGRSASRLELLDGGTVRFSGDLSLENNGGFTSFRSRRSGYDLPESDGLEIRVKGDGRTYIFSVDLAGVPIPAGGYWQEFETEADRWQVIRLPYADFVPTSFGRQLPELISVTAGRIDDMAVFLADKRPGRFAIEFDSIATYSGDAVLASGDLAAGGAAGAASNAGAAGSADDARDDSALLPAECSTLLSLLQKTGLDAAVGELDGFTLFAPTDEAFSKLPPSVVDALLQPRNADALKKVLLHHVVASPVTAWNAAGLDRAEVLDGGVVDIALDESGLRVGGSLVVAADRLRGQGVIHLVDAVIVPDDLELATPMVEVEPSDVLAAAISRGVPLFNDGNVEACAAVYRTAVEATLALSGSELREDTVQTLRDALTRAEREDARSAAWTLRGAMDRAIFNG